MSCLVRFLSNSRLISIESQPKNICFVVVGGVVKVVVFRVVVFVVVLHGLVVLFLGLVVVVVVVIAINVGPINLTLKFGPNQVSNS